MRTILLNGDLLLTYPEEFHIATEEERNHAVKYGEGDYEAIVDSERRMIICIGWKKISGFANLVLNEKDLIKDMEKRLKQPMLDFNYKLEGFFAKKIDGRKAQGYGYWYEAQDIPMYGQSFALKHNKNYYALYFYTREARKEENLPVWEQILDGIRWNQDGQK